MKIERAAVLGSGIMGPGIALVFAVGGLNVKIIDMDAAALERGKAYIEQSLDLLIQKEMIPAPEKEGLKSRISATTDLEKGAAGCDLVIEAVTENPEIKKKALEALDAVLPRHAVIGSNTSSYPVRLRRDTALLEEVRLFRRLVGEGQIRISEK
jgi:3-hydroxybutyryl-CoA dehydrogenase